MRVSVEEGTIYALRLPVLRKLFLFASRSRPRFQTLGEFFDVVEAFGGRYWVLGGADLERRVDSVELVDDGGGLHRALVRGRGWLAVMQARWTGGLELRCLARGAVVDSEEIDEVEDFIDKGWTAYAPMDSDAPPGSETVDAPSA